jgi:predicted CXXCH cytochrome family protein
MNKAVRLLCGFLLCSATAVYGAEKNLIDLHKQAGSISKQDCLDCHSAITKQVTADLKIKTMHRLHLESKLATPKNCNICHQSVDLRESSAAALRRQVNPQLCAGCHGGAVQGAKTLFAN